MNGLNRIWHKKKQRALFLRRSFGICRVCAVCLAAFLCFGMPMTASAEETGPGTALLEGQETEENAEGKDAAAEQASWDAERAGLSLRFSIAGTEKPWLFYRDTYTERQKLFDRNKELHWFMRTIRDRLYTPLTENGIRLVIMIVPDKQTLYGMDYLPEELRPALTAYDRVDQFRDYMKEKLPQLEIYYAKEDMLSAKEKGLPLYYASDSHWNFVGAGVCAEGLMNYLGEEYVLSEKPELSYMLTGETAVGDLQEMELLSGDSSFNRVEYALDGAWGAEKVFTYADPATGEEIYAQYRSTDDRALQKTLYFAGDSYRWYIQYALNGQFRDSFFVQRYQFSAADAIKHHPDVFVYQMPERFLPQFGGLIP